MAIIALVAGLVTNLYWAVATGRNRLAAVLLLLLIPSAAFGVVFGWIEAYNSNRCDEACYPEVGWEGTMDAWQWDALFWTPVAGFVMLVASAAFLRRDSRDAALVAIAAACLAFIAFAVLNAPLTSDY